RSGAVVGAVPLAGAGRGRAWRRGGWPAGLMVAAVCAGPAVVTRAVEARWIASSLGGPFAAPVIRQTDGSVLHGRITGAVHSLLAPTSVGWLDRVTILAMGLLCLAAVMARPRHRPLARWALAGSLVLTAALVLARI